MRFLLRRLSVLAAALLVVSFLVFLIPYLTPGDPTRKILRGRVNAMEIDPAQLASLSAQYGLDRPVLVQYADWLGAVFRGDFGYSYTSQAAVMPQIGAAAMVTLVLAIGALGLAVLVALPSGILAAMRRGGPIDTAITTVTQAFVAVPEYWLAPLLILVFAVKLGTLPSAGWAGPAWMILPCVTLALRPISYFTQITRASMTEVLESPYIVGARARGLSYYRTILRHGIRNALIPVLTLFSVWLGGLLGGSVVVEVIFGIPGMGRLVYNAVHNGDIPMIQASMVTIVTITVLLATLTDVLYTVINPTVRGSHVGS
ncbi:ABC transporter permease [Kribbella sp. NPDC050124]|uniref:ABC transporter permease n=1 Tax=Kribbella sp. NPDC050124 TaxID=3364114 RepID=UPI00378855E8